MLSVPEHGSNWRRMNRTAVAVAVAIAEGRGEGEVMVVVVKKEMSDGRWGTECIEYATIAHFIFIASFAQR